MTSNMKKGANVFLKHTNISRGETSSERVQEHKYKQPYVSWNREMDRHLANVLSEQMVLGYKCDGDTWKPQALQAAVTHLKKELNLSLTKDNIKNRLKIWKKQYNVVSDVQANQSGFTWDENLKMIVVTSDMWSSWLAYTESHPDAKGMHNKMIDNWDEIVLLCGKDRATGYGAETHDEGIEAMGEREEIEVDSAPISRSKARARPSNSSIDTMLEKAKKSKKDTMVEVISAMATTLKEFLASKKKNEEKPSGIEIHDVVSMIPGLSSDQIFMAVRKLMNGDPEEFKLLKSFSDEKKKEYISFIINS